ncbi:MAG: site-specific integrase [Desulfobulbaceae bacterium]|nr:site-specific integrase [Desulfobulbaceae bacterium]
MKMTYQKTFDNYLSLQRVAPKTRSAYLQSVKGLTAYFQQPAEQLTNVQIQDYLLYCIQSVSEKYFPFYPPEASLRTIIRIIAI